MQWHMVDSHASFYSCNIFNTYGSIHQRLWVLEIKNYVQTENHRQTKSEIIRVVVMIDLNAIQEDGGVSRCQSTSTDLRSFELLVSADTAPAHTHHFH